MKKLPALLLILCLLLPAAAPAEETLPRVKFPAANYVGRLDADCIITLDITSYGSFKGAKTVELRDQSNRLVGSRPYTASQELSFKLRFDESFIGGYEGLAVWCEGRKISVNTAYLAVGDSHRKAVTKVDTPEKWISVAIDCTFEDAQTDAILSALAENDAKATFFLTGSFVLSFPESARKIKEAGHEIGCSSWSHPDLMSQGMDRRFNQVRKGSQLLRERLGVIPRLFMPPFNSFDYTVSIPARAEGMEMVIGTLDSRDWDKTYAELPQIVIGRVTKNAEAGSIVVFHLDGYNTAQVLSGALTYYQDTLGLKAVPVGQLITSAGIELPPCPYEETRVRVTQNAI